MDRKRIELNCIDGIVLTPLKRIENPKGDILHALKQSEESFLNFGEAYFTTVGYGVVKGWKKHTKMQMNLIVPVGAVTFFIHEEKANKTEVYTLNHDNYCRLTVAPGLWVAFKGEIDELNLVLNIASIEHDPQEAMNVELEAFSLDIK